MTAASTGRVNPAGAGPTGRRVVHFSLGKSDAPALQTCTNAWVPSFLKKKTPETAENAQPSDAEELKIEVITTVYAKYCITVLPLYRP